MKKWVRKPTSGKNRHQSVEQLVSILLQNRGISTGKQKKEFLHPEKPFSLLAKDVGIDSGQLNAAVARIQKAVKAHESVVVYADYDADGITAGTIMWETLHGMGANVMPYIPHRVDEGYGLSQRGLETVKEQYNPGLIITVDHGITGYEKVSYAKSLGMEVIVTDHHVKPEIMPDCIIVHTTQLCGAGVSWFVAKEVSGQEDPELLALASIGTIADLVPLVGANRIIAKYGLEALNRTARVGLIALLADAGLEKGRLGPYDVSHMLAPRLNAMGRLEHAMDALRLLCTGREQKAMLLAQKLGLTNKERQQLTADMSGHAKQLVEARLTGGTKKKLLFVAEETYNQGVIGLVAGKLVEEYYLPAIVLAKGDIISKASARSISGFNIVEAIRTCSDLLIDVGGHPMAAGFTVETKNLEELQKRLETLAEEQLDSEVLLRTLNIDADVPLSDVTAALWKALRDMEPFGFGNPEPVFASCGVTVADSRLVGKDGKHLKLKLIQENAAIDAIAFGLGSLYGQLRPDTAVDVAYTVDMNVWNGKSSLQLKIRDILVPS